MTGVQTCALPISDAVANLGSCWSVDAYVGDPDKAEAVIEWTHYKQYAGTMLRGVEWYVFDKRTGLIAEIRAYCEADSANTYLLYLRYQKLRGVLDDGNYRRECELLRNVLKESPQPQWKEFLARWND